MNKRLDYIDLAKGFGIIFIIAYHLRILPTYLPHLSGACVPLFFILSGCFFNYNEDFKSFAIKKVNSILVPFLFFYTVPYILFYVFEYLNPGLIKTSAKGILDVFTQDDYFNGPIWFLLSLFWDFLILWCIFNIIKSDLIRFVCVLIFSVLGAVLSMHNVFLPLKLAPACSCLMFLYFGSVFKQIGGLDIKDIKTITGLSFCLFAFAIGVNYLFAPLYLELYNNTIVGNLVINYLIVISFSVGVIYLCRIIGSLPFISYFGRYSLIPLCLHHVVYRPILLVCSTLPSPLNSRYIVTIITLLIIWGLIPISLNLIPWFCGKKPLFRYNYNKDK